MTSTTRKPDRRRYRTRSLAALWWVLAASACWPSEREPTAEEKKAKERLAQRLSVEGFERRLLSTRECEGCELLHAELAGADLRNARLKGAGIGGNLRGADFRGADLTEAALGGDLSQADLRNAKLTGIHLSSSSLKGARFDGADLRSVVNPDGADWSGAILRDANLEGVSFHGLYGGYRRTTPKHLFHASWGGTHLNHADLRGANLRGAVLVKSDLRGADLRGADLRKAVMPYSEDLQDAQLNGAIGPDGRRCAEGSVGRCIPEGKAPQGQRRRGKN